MTDLRYLFDGHRSVMLLDLETTGLCPETDEVIEMAAVIIAYDRERDGVVISDTLNCLVKLPEGQRLSAEITALTGITQNMLDSHGLTPRDAASRFMDMMYGGDLDCVLIVAHNAHFDLSFLNTFLRKYFPRRVGFSVDVLDTLTVLKDRKPYPHRLSDAITHYSLEQKVKNSHRALDDVMALYAVLMEMIRERNDLHEYINLIGYNPRYGVKGGLIGERVQYRPQHSKSPKKLYEAGKLTLDDMIAEYRRCTDNELSPT